MKILDSIATARHHVRSARLAGKSVAIVPTMGALHEGHLSLIDLGREWCDHVVATIFVNPTQFGEGEDFSRYPRILQADLEKLRDRNTDAVFVPTDDMMYPTGFSTRISPPDVAATLEGRHRAGHFIGVATVVMKLFQILPGTHAIFGRKDYQQWRTIAAMVRDLNVDIEIVAADIIRDPDGLAMSSRNRYLTPPQRETALRLSAALRAAETAFRSGQRSTAVLEKLMTDRLLVESDDGAPVDSVDYAVIRHADDLSETAHVDGPAVALIAAHVGSTRLIDNQSLLP